MCGTSAHSIANQVRTFKEENDLIGVKIEEASKRYYPYDNSASHVIGFTSGDDHGLAGLEYYYDDVLSGTNGRIIRVYKNTVLLNFPLFCPKCKREHNVSIIQQKMVLNDEPDA